MKYRSYKLFYTTLPSPLGNMLLIASEKGLSLIEWLDKEGVNYHLKTKSYPMDDRKLAPYKERILEYLEGLRKDLDLPIDLVDITPFRHSVWRQISDIPYGEVRSYRWVAEQIGMNKWFRAIGTALKANPLPIIIPCHRVIRSDGSLGGYSGGIWRKRMLLKIEGVNLGTSCQLE